MQIAFDMRRAQSVDQREAKSHGAKQESDQLFDAVSSSLRADGWRGDWM